MKDSVNRSENSIEEGKSHERILSPYITEKGVVPCEGGDVFYNVIDATIDELSQVLPENGWACSYQAMNFLWMTDKIPSEFRPLIALLESYDTPRLENREKNVLICGIMEVQKYAREHNIQNLDIFLGEFIKYIKHIVSYYMKKLNNLDTGEELDEDDSYKCAEFIKGYDYLEYLLLSNDRIYKNVSKWYALGDNENIISNYIVGDDFDSISNTSWDTGEHRTDHYDRQLCVGAGKYYSPTKSISFIVLNDDVCSDEIVEHGFVKLDNAILINKSLIENNEIGAGCFVHQIYLKSYQDEAILNEAEAEQWALTDIIKFSNGSSFDIFYVLEQHERLFKGLFEHYREKHRPTSLAEYNDPKSPNNKLCKALFGTELKKADILPDDLQRKRDRYTELRQVYQYVKNLNHKYKIKLMFISQEATKINDYKTIGEIVKFSHWKNNLQGI